MRGLTYGLAALFTSISILGFLFKIMHWPGAGIGLVIGVAGIALVAVPLAAIHKYRSAT